MKEAVGLSKAVLARKLKVLRTKGLIKLEKHSGDRRTKVYNLTEEGKAIAQKVKDYFTVAKLAKDEHGKVAYEFRENREILYFSDFWFDGQNLPDSMMFILAGTPTRGIIIVKERALDTFLAVCYIVGTLNGYRKKQEIAGSYVFAKIGSNFELIP